MAITLHLYHTRRVCGVESRGGYAEDVCLDTSGLCLDVDLPPPASSSSYTSSSYTQLDGLIRSYHYNRNSFFRTDYDLTSAYTHEESGNTVCAEPPLADEGCHTVHLDGLGYVPCEESSQVLCRQLGRAKTMDDVLPVDPTMPRYAMRLCLDEEGVYVKAAAFDARGQLFLPATRQEVGTNDFTTTNPLFIKSPERKVTEEFPRLPPTSEWQIVSIRGSVYTCSHQQLLTGGMGQRRYLRDGDLLLLGDYVFVVEMQ